MLLNSSWVQPVARYAALAVSLEGGRMDDLVSGTQKSRQRDPAMHCRRGESSSMKMNESRSAHHACSFHNPQQVARWATFKQATRRAVP
jgi:hypothetical protein